MKNLITSAQTLPLFVGKPGEKPPPLCGAIPADRSYVAKVSKFVITQFSVFTNSQNNFLGRRYGCCFSKRFRS